MKRLTALLFAAALLPSLAAAQEAEKVEAGFLFVKPASGAAIIRELPKADARPVSKPPAGLRLVYRKVVESGGTAAWYRVEPPGMRPGWIAARDTSPKRPTPPPPARPITPVESGLYEARPTAAQTAAARGLADSAKKYAEGKQDLKETVNQFLTLEKAVEDYFNDHHHPMDGSYEDVTVEGRKKRAQEFEEGLR